MDKSQLRQSTIFALKQLSTSNKKTTEQKMMNHLIHTSAWKKANTIGITVSQGMEWNTSIIIEKAWEQGKTICVPKCYPKGHKMAFFQLESFEELEVVYYNLQEPKPVEENKVEKDELDLMIVPGLLFDRSGFRIGFGGGYYDRFLTDYQGQTIALTNSKYLVDSIPKEPHDIAVQQIVTESDIIDIEGD